MRECLTQQCVGGGGGAKGAYVVTELADLGGCLVHEPEAVAGHSHRSVLKQRVGGTLRDCGGQTRVGEIEAVVPHHHVQPGTIATAHFHAVDRRECLLYRQITGDGRGTRIAAGEVANRLGSQQPILAQRPHRVPRGQQFGVDVLDLIGRQPVAGLQLALPGRDASIKLVETGSDTDDEFVATDQRQHSRNAMQ